MKRYYYSYREFLDDVAALSKDVINYNPDTILAVARGGLTFGHFISLSLNNRRLFTLNSIHYNNTEKLDSIEIFNIPDLSSSKKILIVDDIADSGDTLNEILTILKNRYPECQYKTATLFYKSTSLIIPDYRAKEAKEWIDFFWE